MIALIVAGAAVVGIAVGWTLFRKYKLKPSKRFDVSSPFHHGKTSLVLSTRREDGMVCVLAI